MLQSLLFILAWAQVIVEGWGNVGLALGKGGNLRKGTSILREGWNHEPVSCDPLHRVSKGDGDPILMLRCPPQ